MATLQTTRKNTHPNIPALTGLRTIAIAGVLMAHFSAAITALLHLPSAAQDILMYGVYGVPLFFVLSGFVISYQYHDKIHDLRTYGQFLYRRLARIYPSHLMVLIGVVLLYAVIARFGFTPTPFEFPLFLKYAFLIHGWWGFEEGYWNSPSWSLSAEWFAYIIFPLINFILLRTRSKAAFILYMNALVFVFILSMQLLNQTNLSPWGTSLPHIVPFFIAGCACHHLFSLYQPQHPRFSAAPIFALAAIGTVIFVIFSFYNPLINPWWATLYFPVIIWAVACDKTSGFKRFLEHPIMVRTGKASYAIYITHITPQLILYKMLPFEPMTDAPLPFRLGFLIFYLGTVLAIGFAVHLLFENPLRYKLTSVRFLKR